MHPLPMTRRLYGAGFAVIFAGSSKALFSFAPIHCHTVVPPSTKLSPLKLTCRGASKKLTCLVQCFCLPSLLC